MKRILTIIILLGLLVAIVLWRVSFRNADLSVGNVKAAFTVQATALQQEFESDEDNANSKYLNKVISVSGNVAKVEKAEDGLNVTLQDPDAMSGVICGFHVEIAKESDFRIGETITVKGLCTGYLFDVVLVKCAVE